MYFSPATDHPRCEELTKRSRLIPFSWLVVHYEDKGEYVVLLLRIGAVPPLNVSFMRWACCCCGSQGEVKEALFNTIDCGIKQSYRVDLRPTGDRSSL